MNAEQIGKVGSALLLRHAREKVRHAASRLMNAEAPMLTTVIYAEHAPTPAETAELEERGVRAYPASWIPAVGNHPLGFFIAKVPVDKIGDVLSMMSVRKMDSAERLSHPQNNVAAVSVKASLAWGSGWTGSGVKVAVIDSGLDDALPATELPGDKEIRNYAFYPDSVNNNVRNTVTGHGTHVAGTVLGKGGYSTSPVLNTANRGGAYKGMAPDAKLVFLKIGRISTSQATDAAMVGAIKAAVDTYGAKVINLSYGGWEAYHDGSDMTEQALDYAFSKGAACFVSAGNWGSKGYHYSGTVAGLGTSPYIEVNVTNAGINDTKLSFNLVWSDGLAHNGLGLNFYSAGGVPLSNVIAEPTTESPRGTESAYAICDTYVPAGSLTYLLRVSNPSSAAQTFHIYEEWGNGKVKFALPDPSYTINSPAAADHAFAVGAYTSRGSWIDYAGNPWSWGLAEDEIVPFSARGPRIDGMQKPNITAPGHEIISIRDRDVYATPNWAWIDNDGTVGGDANYYLMEGTSMASPVAAGCAALMFQHTPAATPQQIYDAIEQTGVADTYTGSVPNMTWGHGKLDVNAALQSSALPVELASFTSEVQNGAVLLSWTTATETNNYGFEVERKMGASASSSWAKIGFVPGAGTTSAPHEYAFTDRFAHTGVNAYRLKQIDRDGSVEYSCVVEAAIEGAPVEYALAQNYPNPFNPSTTLQFSIARKGHVRLLVYDLLGRVRAVLVDREMEPGSYAAEWKADGASSGVYLCRLESGGFTSVKKLILQK
ncbi:MAG: S8 family peptidase [Acidobacteriota bacterium]